MWSVHINTVFRKKESEVAIASAEIYDPEANIFTPTGAMNEAWVGHTATLLPNGQVLIVGGWGVGRRNSTAEPYDPQTGEFRLVTSMSAPEDQIVRETRFRRRLRLDTYGHYPEHAEAIRAWRERRSAG